MNIPKAKYDWQKIKIDFFESNFTELKGFFEEKYGTYNGRTLTKTTGWSKEKEQWQREITKKALRQLNINRLKDLADCLDMLLIVVYRQIKKYTLMPEVNTKELKTLWEIVRCENNLPIRITQMVPLKNNFDPVEVRKGILERIKNHN